MSRETHPTTQELRRWLESGEPDWVEEHLADCSHCTQILETEAPLPSAVRETLVAVTDPAPDLSERMTDRVAAAARRLDALTTLVELLAVGWRAPLALLDEPNEGEQ